MKALHFAFSTAFIAVVVLGNSVADDIAAEWIPGTRLKTRTPYKIGCKAFLGSILTWTDKTGPDGYHYVQVDNTPDRLPNYSRGGKWFTDALWEFIPVPLPGNSKWYRMVNRGKPKESLTWSPYEGADQGQTNYVILDSNSKEMRSDHDFLIKPVRATVSSGEYYQFTFKGLPKAFFTYSSKLYGDKNQRYAMVDNSRLEHIRQRYEDRGVWYDQTLFSFEMVVGI